MIEVTFSSFHDQSCDLWADEITLTAWESDEIADVTILTAWKTEFAEINEFIFLSAVLTALWKKQHKIVSTDFAADRMTFTIEESDVEEISAEIAAESSENSWSVSKSFISMRLDFLRNISFLFSLMSILQDITIKLISQLYNQ